jgi:hypothetical protein
LTVEVNRPPGDSKEYVRSYSLPCCLKISA